jgi:hypothetical protein
MTTAFILDNRFFREQTVDTVPVTRQYLQDYSLDLIEGDLVIAAVVELGCAGAFVRRHLLGV